MVACCGGTGWWCLKKGERESAHNATPSPLGDVKDKNASKMLCLVAEIGPGNRSLCESV